MNNLVQSCAAENGTRQGLTKNTAKNSIYLQLYNLGGPG
jgi:hypothetical protein